MSKAPKAADIIEQDKTTDSVGKRIEEMRAKRKERSAMSETGFHQKLSVPQKFLDPRLQHRWVVDRGTRVIEMEQKGYFPVSSESLVDDDRNSGIGSVTQRVANSRTTEGGRVEHTILMAKPKEFYEEDKAREIAKIKAEELAITRGERRDADGKSAEGTYVPSGGTSIKHGG